MHVARFTLLASLMVIFTGTMWGFYWLPVREIADLGLTGAWGTAAIVLSGFTALVPFAWRGRASFAQADWLGLGSLVLGGFAFVLYSLSFLYGQVAIVVILFFLSPVWSTLLGRVVLGWPISGKRVLVLVFGLAGLGIMLGAEGVLPLPRNLGEWLGLISGFLWSVASIGLRVKTSPPPPQAACLFAAGGVVGGLLIAPFLSPLPQAEILTPTLLTWVVVAGAFWWAFTIAGLMWAVPKLDPARTGILLMIEAPVAAASAAMLISEHLSTAELVGGALVLLAGLLEVLPARRLA